MGLIIGFLVWALMVYSWIIFVYVLLSWFPHSTGIMGKIYDALGSVCDPYLNLFKKIIPPVGNGGVAVDFSPILGFVVLQILSMVLQRLF